MSSTEGLQPLTPGTNHLPVDPNVRIPDSVKAASAASDAIHKAAYTPPAATPAAPAAPAPAEPAPAPAAPAPAEAAAPAAPVVHQDQQHQHVAPSDDFTGPADAQSLADSEWARRYNSMRGRYEQQVRANGGMEQQMRDLAQELMRTQNALASLQSQPPAPQQSNLGQAHGNVITNEDVEGFGDELINMARRAARDALTPEIEALRAQNAELTNRVKSVAKRELFQAMDSGLPMWRQINKDTRFLAWLRLPNIYTGRVRGEMLKAAVDGGNAPQALQLFRDFLTEAQATGQIAPAAQSEQQQAPTAAPREPALDLGALAAPGRAKPSSGDTQVPAEKPIYSRAQISKFYEDSRKGLWAGREAEYRAIEADLSAAQREGRIR